MGLPGLRRSILALPLAALAAGCLGGSFIGGPGDDDNAGDDDDVAPGADGGGIAQPDAGPPPDFAMTMDTMAAELVLGETKTFIVTVTGANGFAGDVSLVATGILPTWQVAFDPVTVNVAAGGQATSTLTLTIPTDAEAGDATLAVQGTGAPGMRETPGATLSVKPELRIRIPQGSVDNPDNSFGPNGGNLTVRYVAPGTKVVWINDDNVEHRIHADNVAGFNHQPNNMSANGGSYTVTIGAPGTYDYNCHIHAQMRGRLVVQ